MKKAIKLLAFILLTVGISHISPNLHEKFLLKYLDHYSVELLNMTGNFRGSGLLFTDHGKTYIASAAHVCGRIDDEVEIVSDNLNFSKNAKVLKIDAATDTCIMESPIEISFIGPKLGSRSDRIDNIYYVGYPMIRKPFFAKGYMSSEIIIKTLMDLRPGEGKECLIGNYIEEYSFFGNSIGCEFDITLNYASIPGFSGASGSGVTNAFGNIVGIVSHGNSQFNDILMLAKVEELNKLMVEIIKEESDEN